MKGLGRERAQIEGHRSVGRANRHILGEDGGPEEEARGSPGRDARGDRRRRGQVGVRKVKSLRDHCAADRCHRRRTRRGGGLRRNHQGFRSAEIVRSGGERRRRQGVARGIAHRARGVGGHRQIRTALARGYRVSPTQYSTGRRRRQRHRGPRVERRRQRAARAHDFGHGRLQHELRTGFVRSIRRR